MTGPAVALDGIRAHLAAEVESDLELTVATMEPPYFRELWPLGMRMEGYEITRAYYEHHFRVMRPRMRSSRVGEWETESGLVLESRMEVLPTSAGEEPDVFRILTALIKGPEGRVMGEKIFAADSWHRMNVGHFLDTAFAPTPP